MTAIASGIRERQGLERTGGTRHAPPSFAPAGQSTQLIVGATPTSDREILNTASGLYERHGLRRVYYSAFSPIPDSDARLPPRPPPLAREHRLYQADWLIRHYGFQAHELTAASENLALDIDPKLAWALERRELFPIDVNRADRELLLRVPGLGVRSVDRILKARRQRTLTAEHLRLLGAAVRRAAPFLKLGTASDAHGRAQLDSLHLKQRVRPAQQLELFDAVQSRVSGEV
jgi:predicted DNA-binding helix-hairpin-helix protein